jgi:TonB-linked SusC/RagA family outer membrane protein
MYQHLPVPIPRSGWHLFFCALIIFTLTLTAAAQTGQSVSRSISGRITDAGSGEALPGVSLVQKGTTRGTTTDTEGRYRLDISGENPVLVVSFIGYTTEELAVGNRTQLDVTLAADLQTLSEVVVVGYGQQQKANLTGSVATVKTRELVQAPVANISNALVGRLPGLIAVQSTGEPGSDGSSLLIRGVSTFGSSSAPLIVIDGIPRPDYGFSQIDPNEIESISILKDAASAAVFGVRGANGVILVTTKRGKAGKTNLNFSARTDWQMPTRMPEYLDSYNMALLLNEAYRNEGKPELYSPQALEAFRTGSNPDVYPNTDWAKEALRSSAPQQQYNLSASGGTDKIRYFVSAGHLDQQGLLEKNRFKRYNLRSNIDANVTATTRVSLDISGRAEDRQYPYKDANQTFWFLNRNRPTAAAYYSNGLPGNYIGENPAEAPRHGYKKDMRYVFQGMASLVQQLPFVDGLSLKGVLAYDSQFRTYNQWNEPFSLYNYNATTDQYTALPTGPASLSQSFDQVTNLTTEAHVNYARTFGKHDVSALVLFTQTDTRFANLQAARANYTQTTLDQLFAGNDAFQTNTGGADQRARRGYVGRVNYAYGNRYFLEANFRYDGSENFPREKRWGFFPSFSAGWRISDEAFMRSTAKAIDFLKIRASWGRLGNDAIGRFKYLSTYSYSQGYVFGQNPQQVKGLRQGELPNQNITWEVATSSNIGLEGSLWKGRLGFELDYFYKRTSNILTKRNLAVPATLGAQLPFENAGIQDNRGVEAALTHQNQIGAVTINLRGNFTFVKNKVVFKDEPADKNPNIRETGRSLNQFFGYRATGLFQSQEEIDAAPKQTNSVKPGDIRYEDINGDGKIDAQDVVQIGRSTVPQVIYGFSADAQYKGLDLSLFFQGATRVNAYVDYEAAWAFYNSGKALKTHLDRWTADNPDASYPRLTTQPTANNTETSSYWLKDASYLRLKNLELGYTLPTALLEKARMSTLRVFVSGQNLLTFSPLKTLDPEGPGNSANSTRGGFYPQQKVYAVGINVGF